MYAVERLRDPADVRHVGDRGDPQPDVEVARVGAGRLQADDGQAFTNARQAPLTYTDGGIARPYGMERGVLKPSACI